MLRFPRLGKPTALLSLLPPLALGLGSLSAIYYGFVLKKPNSISDMVVAPYPVRPDSSFRISGQFKDKDGNPAFVPQAFYYVYNKVPPQNPGEVETRMLLASGT